MPTDVPLVWDETGAVAAVGGDRGLALTMLAERVHRCKGGAAYCGVPELVAALAALDASARAGSRRRAEPAMAVVAAAIAGLQPLDVDAITR
jgi:HPt (histidine-containing phosphotransfer) domain-containing protein